MMENFPVFDAVCVEGPTGGPVYEYFKKRAIEFYIKNGCKDEFVYIHHQWVNYKFKIEHVSNRGADKAPK